MRRSLSEKYLDEQPMRGGLSESCQDEQPMRAGLLESLALQAANGKKAFSKPFEALGAKS